MMKFKLMLLMLSIFLAGSYAGVVLVEDFEGGTSGSNLSSAGWYAINGTDINNLISADSVLEGYGLSGKIVTGYIQAKKDFVNTITDTDADIYAKFAITTGNQNMKFGAWGVTRPGFYLDITPGGDIKLTPANYGTTAVSTDSYTLSNNTSYEFVVQMTNINNGARAAVKVRNLTVGDTDYTELEGLQDVYMNFLNTDGFAKPSNFAAIYARGGFNGYLDYIELGTGIAPEPVEPSPVVAFDDFEGGTLGQSLSSDGWYAINGTDIAGLVAQNSTLYGYGLSGKVSNSNMQAKKDFVNTITDSDTDIYGTFTITTGNQPMFFGAWGTVRPGFYIIIMPGDSGYIKLQPANYGTVAVSTDSYQLTNNTSYEFVIQMTNISDGGGKGSVKVRNLSAGEITYTDLEGLQDIPMNFLNVAGYSKPSDFAAFFIRGAYNGYFESLELGTGIAPIETGEKVVLATEDFETATIGNILSDEGWTNLYSTLPSWFIANGVNGTKSAECDPAKPDTQWAKIFADPNELDDLENEANIYFEVDITPKSWASMAQTIRAGILSSDANRPGFYLGFSKNAIDNTKWDIYFHNALSMPVGTPNMEWTNSDMTITSGNTYRFHVQITNNSTGSIFIKNLTLNEPCWSEVANMQNITMNFSTLTRPKLFNRWYIRGAYAPHQVDNFELGTGIMSECDVYCDPALSGLAGDLNGDCSVGMDDLNIAAAGWLGDIPANLITNGDFSQVDAETGLPVGWNYVTWNGDGDPIAGNMYCQVVDGQLAQMMEKGIPIGYFGVYQVINVVPGRDYTVNATWSGSTVDKGWAEILLYCVDTPEPTKDDLYTLIEEGAIVAKHDGFGDAAAAFGPESITAAMYHEHCLVDPVNGGTNVRTATTPYMVIRTNLGSITPDSSGGVHELYIDDIVVTGAGAPDVSGDGNVNLIDFAIIADEWLTEAMGPY